MFPKSIQDTIKVTLTIIVLGVFGALLFVLKDVFVLLFVAFIFASALLPVVNGFNKFNAPRWLSILLVYVLVFAVLGVVLWGIIPLLAVQIRTFFSSLPAIFEQVIQALHVQEMLHSIDVQSVLLDILKGFSDEILSTPTNLIEVLLNVFSSFANIFILIVFSYYILLEHDRMRKHLLLLFSKSSRKEVADILERVEGKLGAWLRGQLVVMFLTGIVTFVGLNILQIKFSASLAILAGLFEIVPLFGPIIAVIPAIMVALTQSAWHAVGVVVLFLIIQQLGGVTITPKIMNKAVGVDPFVIILAIMIGGRLAGTAGILLAIPSAAIISIFWDEFLARRS